MKHRSLATALLSTFVLASCDGAASLAQPVEPGSRAIAPPTCPAVAHTDDRIEIRSPTLGSAVRWRRIGDPDHQGFRTYDAPVLVLNGGIEAIATTVEGDTSEPASCAVILATDSTLASPVLSPAYDTFEYAIDSIDITSDLPGAVIRYTLDESDVDSTAPVWSGPMALPRSGRLVVKALATGPGWHASRMIRRVFTSGVAPWNHLVRYDTILDPRTGLEYPIVSLGSQVWFAKNLFLPRRKAYAEAARRGTAYEPAEVKGDPKSPLCPEGWRIPTREDWKILATWVGSQQASSSERDPFHATGDDPHGLRFLPLEDPPYWNDRYVDGVYTSASGRSEAGFWTSSLLGDSLILASPNSDGFAFLTRPDTLPHIGDRLFPPMVPAAPIRCLKD